MSALFSRFLPLREGGEKGQCLAVGGRESHSNPSSQDVIVRLSLLLEYSTVNEHLPQMKQDNFRWEQGALGA